MNKIDLKNNNAYKWISDGENYFIGHVYYKNKFYINNEALSLIKEKKEDVENFLREIDGRFSFLLNLNEKIILVSDLLRAYPMFYSIEDNNIVITDNIMSYLNKKIDSDSIEELESSGYVTGMDTIFENIYQLQGHEIVYINKNTKEIERKKYWNYKYNIHDKENEILIRELDEIYNNAAKKMIQYLNGRKAIVPLSGGQDSRLLAYYLKRNGYTNVLTYTYGSKNNSELETSKKVAEFLGFEWIFIPYENKSMQRKFNDKEKYRNMADYCGRGFSIPVIQEWEAVSKLIENKKVIPSESVIISGHVGDFPAGYFIYEYLFNKEKITWKELKEFIFKSQYQYASKSFDKSIINEKINKICNKYNDNEVMSRNESIELYESIEFEERETKYFTNALRMYDYYGIEWYVLFWDKTIIEKWLSIPIEKRYKRSLFEQYTKTIYNDLMEYAPIFKGGDKEAIRYPFKFIKKIFRLIDIYRNGFLNSYGYFYFRTYIKYFLETRKYQYNKLLARHYVHYLKNILK